MILEDKTLLVVGAGPGLGHECAVRALRDGASAVLLARNQERLDEMAAELDPWGDRVLAYAADVGDQEAVDAAVAAAVERFGQLDAVVHVAAASPLGRFEEIDDDAWRSAFEVNVLGTVHVVRAVVPAMEAGGGGSVVLIGSQASLKPVASAPQGAYGSSKMALLSAARDMAEELGPKGIRVNTVVPTWMWGPMVEVYCRWQASERDMTPEEIKAEIEATMALREMPTDGDVAEAVMFFASDRSRMITGQRLLVNAGEFYPD
jgi:NAD(P)-dependent dehydrogenase (short-subunit alcohol dehydrogenase family)